MLCTRASRTTSEAPAAERRTPALTWDLGTNDGNYARIAARSSDYVIAMEADHATVEQLYRALRVEDATCRYARWWRGWPR